MKLSHKKMLWFERKETNKIEVPKPQKSISLSILLKFVKLITFLSQPH